VCGAPAASLTQPAGRRSSMPTSTIASPRPGARARVRPPGRQLLRQRRPHPGARRQRVARPLQAIAAAAHDRIAEIDGDVGDSLQLLAESGSERELRVVQAVVESARYGFGPAGLSRIASVGFVVKTRRLIRLRVREALSTPAALRPGVSPRR